MARQETHHKLEAKGSATYELWDTCSGDLVGRFTTKDAALGPVRDAIARHNRTFAEYFLLIEVNGVQTSRAVAEGKALVILALAIEGRQ